MSGSIIKFIKNNWPLLLIIFVGLFLRIYKAEELFLYGHDQDLAGWFVKDVVVNRHLRLIGQETSTHGVFIGPFYYYLLIFFYIISGMDPIGGVYMITVLGLLSIVSIYYVFRQIFGKRVGIISSLIYATSYYTVFNDREVVPTMPQILWTVWFLYVLNLILKRNQVRGFVLAGLLTALVWHINFSLILIVPLVFLALLLSGTKLSIKAVFCGLSSLLIFSLPLILFELRHSFVQVRGVFDSLTTNQKDIISGFAKFERVVYLVSKNASGLLVGSIPKIPYSMVLYALLIIFIFLVIRKKIEKYYSIIFASWIFTYIVFFSLYSKIVSEYYLNGLIIVFLAIVSIFINSLIQKYRLIAFLLLSVFLLTNIYKIITVNVNRSGYLERKAIVEEIKSDSLKHSYPCVSVSYITDPGYDLGYRYFFWLAKLHVNRPDSLSPVYTIVYPLNDKLFPVNITFGSLGLIYPDYSRYTQEEVKISCSGEDSNITDPMFGFTN